MGTVLFTGFPGFLGVGLVPRLLETRDRETQVHCLIQAKYANYAKKKLRDIEEAHPEYHGRIHLQQGDVTDPALALADGKSIKKKVDEVFHLAAVYDLTVDRDLARRVNVNGTRNVLSFAGGSDHLTRFNYVSTCFVSGRYPGHFRETDLEVGQTFNNFFDEMAFEAEMSMAQARAEGMPVTVYRPSSVMGDSQTGETQKYDGLYPVIRWLLTLPPLFFFPAFGGGHTFRINIVPRDFVVDAIAYLSRRPESLGKTYHLADPRPLKVAPLVRLLGQATRRALIPLPCPKEVAKLALTHSRSFRRWMQIPSQTLDLFTQPTLYSTENMMVDLKGSGISCPPVENYLQTLVDFMRMHGEITSRAMA
ncbi:MAG: SDR family oxidoreductase [bacterium]